MPVSVPVPGLWVLFLAAATYDYNYIQPGEKVPPSTQQHSLKTLRISLPPDNLWVLAHSVFKFFTPEARYSRMNRWGFLRRARTGWAVGHVGAEEDLSVFMNWVNFGVNKTKRKIDTQYFTMLTEEAWSALFLSFYFLLTGWWDSAESVLLCVKTKPRIRKIKEELGN